MGNPPRELANLPASVRQFSPLLPGAESLELLAPSSLEEITLLAPPGTIERRYVLAQALRALAPEGRFIAMAPKDKGGSRIAKELREFGCEFEEDARHHFRICAGRKPNVLLPSIETALAEGAPRFSEELGAWTQPGIFSWDRVDPGSTLLLENLPPFHGRGADLGCGNGFLSKALLKNSKVTHLTLVDVDRRATELAQKNLEADAARITVLWRDMRTAELEISNLDFVVTNPPFHDAGMEDQSLGQEFLRRASTLLKKGGACWIVANRHLPYEAVLRPLFSQVRSVAEANGFKVIEAIR